MKQTWEAAENNLMDFKIQLEELLDMLPQSVKFNQKNAKLIKAWKKVQSSLNEMDKFITPVKSIDVKSPLLADAGFRAGWNMWKEYLNEQHGIFMRSRAEMMSLKRLMDISENNVANANHYLEFAMSRLEKNFYKVNDAPEPKKSDNATTGKFVIKLPEKYRNKPVEPLEGLTN